MVNYEICIIYKNCIQQLSPHEIVAAVSYFCLFAYHGAITEMNVILMASEYLIRQNIII